MISPSANQVGDMHNRCKDFSIFLLAVSVGLAGCSLPLAKPNSILADSSLGFSNQFIDQDGMVLSLTIPLRKPVNADQ